MVIYYNKFRQNELLSVIKYNKDKNKTIIIIITIITIRYK